MKKVLYITANSKPEELSASKTVGRAFVNRLLERYPNIVLEEVDVYKEHIPRLEYPYFEKRNCIVSKEAFEKLNEEDKKEVHKIVKLCDQFKEADIYVIASPMWSLSFPAPLKEYIDCVLQDGKTIKIEEDKVEPLLDDKYRTMIYIQSSGGKIPWIMKPIMNKGLNYVEDIMKFMGIKDFEELLVQGTGFTEEEKTKAIEAAKEKIDHIIDYMKID